MNLLEHLAATDSPPCMIGYLPRQRRDQSWQFEKCVVSLRVSLPVFRGSHSFSGQNIETFLCSGMFINCFGLKRQINNVKRTQTRETVRYYNAIIKHACVSSWSRPEIELKESKRRTQVSRNTAPNKQERCSRTAGWIIISCHLLSALICGYNYVRLPSRSQKRTSCDERQQGGQHPGPSFTSPATGGDTNHLLSPPNWPRVSLTCERSSCNVCWHWFGNSEINI